MKVKLQKNERMKGRQNLLFKKFVRVDSTSLMAKSCMPILRVWLILKLLSYLLTLEDMVLELLRLQRFR